MSIWGKATSLVLVTLLLIMAFLIPSIANAQITSSYGNNNYINTTAFALTIYSPDNQTYNSIMPLNFTIEWTTYPTFYGIPSPLAPILNGVYNYTIDDNPAVTVISNQSSNDVFGYSNFKVNPTFSYLVNVSNLTNGYHKIVIAAILYAIGGNSTPTNFNRYLVFGASSSPVQFLVQNPTSSPTPSSAIGTLISSLTISIVAIVIAVAVIVIAVLLYRRRRKSIKLS